MTTLPAPPDLCELIDAYLTAKAGPDSRARVDTCYALYRWEGWRKRVRYVHGGTAVSMIWGSLKVVKWPSERPEPVQLTELTERK